jgi:hypothetical protein
MSSGLLRGEMSPSAARDLTMRPEIVWPFLWRLFEFVPSEHHMVLTLADPKWRQVQNVAVPVRETDTAVNLIMAAGPERGCLRRDQHLDHQQRLGEGVKNGYRELIGEQQLTTANNPPSPVQQPKPCPAASNTEPCRQPRDQSLSDPLHHFLVAGIAYQ